MNELIEKANQFHMNTYARFPVVFAKAAGTKVWDVNGKEYTDFLSGIGVLNFGHCPPRIVDAFCRQARELGHASNWFCDGSQLVSRADAGHAGGDGTAGKKRAL